jgi:hypothetical protein
MDRKREKYFIGYVCKVAADKIKEESYFLMHLLLIWPNYQRIDFFEDETQVLKNMKRKGAQSLEYSTRISGIK